MARGSAQFKVPEQLRSARAKSGALEFLRSDIISALPDLHRYPKARVAQILRTVDPTGRSTLQDLCQQSQLLKRLVDRQVELWSAIGRLISPMDDLASLDPRSAINALISTVVPLCGHHLILTRVHGASWFAPSADTWQKMLLYFKGQPLKPLPGGPSQEGPILTNDPKVLWDFQNAIFWTDSLWERLHVEIQVIIQGLQRDFRQFEFVNSQELGDSIPLTAPLCLWNRWQHTRVQLFDPPFIPKGATSGLIRCSRNIMNHPQLRELRRTLLEAPMASITINNTHCGDEHSTSEITLGPADSQSTLFVLRNSTFRSRLPVDKWGSVSWNHVLKDDTGDLITRLRLPNLGSMIVLNDSPESFPLELSLDGSAMDTKISILATGALRESLYYIESYLCSKEAMLFQNFLAHQYNCSLKDVLKLLPYPTLNFTSEPDYAIVQNLRPFFFDHLFLKAEAARLLSSGKESTLHELIVAIAQTRRNCLKSIRKMSKAQYPCSWMVEVRPGVVEPKDPNHFQAFQDSVAQSVIKLENELNQIQETISSVFQVILSLRAAHAPA